jgi:hypothetical protein
MVLKSLRNCLSRDSSVTGEMRSSEFSVNPVAAPLTEHLETRRNNHNGENIHVCTTYEPGRLDIFTSHFHCGLGLTLQTSRFFRDPAMRWSAKRLLQHEFVSPTPTPRRSLSSSSENPGVDPLSFPSSSTNGGNPLETSNGQSKSSPRVRRAAVEAANGAPLETVDQTGLANGNQAPGSNIRSSLEKPRVELPNMVPQNLKTLRPPSPGAPQNPKTAKPLSIAVPQSLPNISAPPSPSSGGQGSGKLTPTNGSNTPDYSEMSRLRGPSSLSSSGVKGGANQNGSPRFRETNPMGDLTGVDQGAVTGRTRASTTSSLPSPTFTLPEVMNSPKSASPKSSPKLPSIDGRLEVLGSPTGAQVPSGSFRGTPSRFAEGQPSGSRQEGSSSPLPLSPGRARGSLLLSEEKRQRSESTGALEIKAGAADVASRVRAAIFGGVSSGLSRTQSDEVVARAGYNRPSDNRLSSTIDGPQHIQKRESTDVSSRLRAAVFGSSEQKRVSTANEVGYGQKRPSDRERTEGLEWGLGAHQRRRSSGGEYGYVETAPQETAAALEASWMNGFLSPPRNTGKATFHFQHPLQEATKREQVLHLSVVVRIKP